MPLAAADDLLNSTGAISNQEVVGSIIVIASNFISPFGVSIICGPICSPRFYFCLRCGQMT
eukprot:9442783-Ditylum_brightwellii.AAC.1